MNNQIQNSLRKTALFLLGLLVVLFLYVSYIQIIASDSLSAHPLNRRTVELERRVERGAILDTNGEKLAYSEQKPDKTWQRSYPLGAIAAHVTGYVSSRYGITGLEGVYNRQLSGLSNPERRLGAVLQLMPSQAGSTIVLTVDSSLQITAWKALGPRRGAVVALDPRTGAILAMVSRPSFDPEEIESSWANISTAMESPLLNRATQGLYPPGSIVKPLVAEAALSEKIVAVDKTFQCEGKLKIGLDYVLHESNNQAHGKVDLEEALAVSCNVTFGQLALQLGRSKLAHAYDKYGFSRPTSTEIADTPARFPDFSHLSDGDLAQAGIGQGSILTTPLKMAMLAAAIGNKGVMMKPYMMQKIIDSVGRTIHETKPDTWLTPISPAIAAEVTKMMVSAVNEGTGSSARISGIRVAGKTGTAENPHGAPHSWFIGFAPADAPQVAIAVVVENGGSGGAVAAPIARQVLAQALQ